MNVIHIFKEKNANFVLDFEIWGKYLHFPFPESVHFHGGSPLTVSRRPHVGKCDLPDGVWRREGCQMDGLDEAVTLMPRGAEFPHFPTQEGVPRLSAPPFRRQRTRRALCAPHCRTIVRTSTASDAAALFLCKLSCEKSEFEAAISDVLKARASRCAARRRTDLEPFLRSAHWRSLHLTRCNTLCAGRMKLTTCC